MKRKENAMGLANFTVCCTDSQCRSEPATYKIAAEWTGGGYTELKTFGFANASCLSRVFLAAAKRRNGIRLAEGESLGPLRVYRLEKGRHDYELHPEPELEAKLHAELA